MLNAQYIYHTTSFECKINYHVNFTPRDKRTSAENEDDAKYTSDEARLIADLLSRYKSYKTLARPVLNSNATLMVYFGISLQQILDFDEKDQVLQTRMWKEYVSIYFKSRTFTKSVYFIVKIKCKCLLAQVTVTLDSLDRWKR